MFLLSRSLVEGVYFPKGMLHIQPFQPENYVSGAYGFRLGAVATDSSPRLLKENLTLLPGETKAVWSLETLSLRGRVLGLLGNSTSLLTQGVELLDSPCINPDFDGCLELQLRNWKTTSVSLPPASTIGKLLLFDVSETFGEQGPLDEKELPAAFRKRKRASEEILKDLKRFPEYQLRQLENQGE